MCRVDKILFITFCGSTMLLRSVWLSQEIFLYFVAQARIWSARQRLSPSVSLSDTWILSRHVAVWENNLTTMSLYCSRSVWNGMSQLMIWKSGMNFWHPSSLLVKPVFTRTLIIVAVNVLLLAKILLFNAVKPAASSW